MQVLARVLAYAVTGPTPITDCPALRAIMLTLEWAGVLMWCTLAT